MSPEEAAEAKKMMAAGPPPGGCKGKEECEAYCQDPAHAEECMAFAERAGLISPEEAERARKGMEIIQRGGPGGCKSEKECRLYCQDPAHMEECLNFAVEQGFMSPEEAQKIREMMQIAPPGTQPAPMPPEGMPPGEIPPVPSEGMPTIPPAALPPGFEGKCATPQECIQYCFQHPQDPACQAMMPTTPKMMAPPPEMIPPPKGTLPPPPPPTETPPSTETPP